ncbi:hypothetical protein LP419_07490 [Massilia sp. H-1]|nr:hypothetical protein LP419_07490 [Massilia sp. H-1]
MLTVGAIDGGRLQAVRAVALPDGASLEWLERHIAREALRLNLPVPARLQLAGLAACGMEQQRGRSAGLHLAGPGRGRWAVARGAPGRHRNCLMSELQIDFSAPGVQRTLHRTGPRTWAVAKRRAAAVPVRRGAGRAAAGAAARRPAPVAGGPPARGRAGRPGRRQDRAPHWRTAGRRRQCRHHAAQFAVARAARCDRRCHAARDCDAGAGTGPRKRTMKITAEAKSSDAMIGYVEELKKQELFMPAWC